MNFMSLDLIFSLDFLKSISPPSVLDIWVCGYLEVLEYLERGSLIYWWKIQTDDELSQF